MIVGSDNVKDRSILNIEEQKKEKKEIRKEKENNRSNKKMIDLVTKPKNVNRGTIRDRRAMITHSDQDARGPIYKQEWT